MEPLTVLGVILFAFIGAFVTKRLTSPTEGNITLLSPGLASIVIVIFADFAYPTHPAGL